MDLRSLTLLLLTALMVPVFGQDLFYFTKHPESKTVAAGEAVALLCEVSHTDKIITYWSFNETRVENNPRKQQIGRNLKITRADPILDVGEYACIAENTTTGYSLTSRTASINVVWLDKVTVQSTTTDFKEGNDVVLRCTVDGNDVIKYEWFRNEQPLYRSERIQLKASKGQLTLRQVNPTDNGVYSCGASNMARSIRSAEPVVLRLWGQHTPNVTAVPRNQIVRKGDAAVFNCAFEAADEIKWHSDDGLITNSSKNKIVFKNGTFIIPKVKISDEGAYLCTGVRKRGGSVEDVESYSANLTVAFLEELSDSSFEPPLQKSVLIISRHSRLDLTCIPPNGVPKPKVEWLTPKNQVITGSSIIFNSVTENDDGNYTCIVENLAGVKKHAVKVIVSVPPIPSRQSRTEISDEGAPLSLPCIYQGSSPPATTFQWLRDGHLMKGMTAVNPVNGSLTLFSTQSGDRGKYVCEIHTVGFPAALTAPINVQIRETLKFMPKPVDKKIELGSHAQIHCKAQGSPPPKIVWVKGYGAMTQSLPPNMSLMNGTLYLKNATMADKGKYTCLATNSQGTIEITIDVDVIVAPWFTVMPQNSTEVQEGLPVTIHCMAEGDPKPTITWDKGGDMDGLDEARFKIFTNGTLHVTTVYKTDYGRYGCIAGNSGGFRRLETELIVLGSGEDEEEESMMLWYTVVITLSAVAGYMALVIGMMVWCRYRRRKRKQAYLTENPEGILLAKAENGDVKAERLDADGKKNIGEERQGDGAETAHSQSSGQSRKSGRGANYDKLALPRQNLRDLKLIGHGSLGQVFIGRAEHIKTPIAVKALQNIRDETALAEFKREIDMLHRVSHENVAKLVGLCREADPHYLILEYTDWGDLKQFLQSTRKERSKLSTSQLLQIAKEISLGMEQLSNLRHVHRDLGARNCLVTSDLQAKVTLMGLSKDTHSSDYAQFHNQTLPIRWLPAEAVFEDDFSTKSDIYSFAILCWELFHQGDRPFSNLSDEQVLERLECRDLTVKVSKHLPPKAASVVMACASVSPKDRPTFSSVAIALCEVLKEL